MNRCPSSSASKSRPTCEPHHWHGLGLQGRIQEMTGGAFALQGGQQVTRSDQLAAWTELCRGRLEILPGGSIRADNAATLLAKTGARGLHFRAPKLRNRDQAAHPLGSSDTGLHEVTDPEVVRAIRQAVS